MLWISSILCVLVIASAHWLASKVATRPDREQVRWASFGGGAGIAYVFVHLLPELASHGQALSEAPGMETFAPTPITEALLFLIALAGIMVTYSLDVLAPMSDRLEGLQDPCTLSISQRSATSTPIPFHPSSAPDGPMECCSPSPSVPMYS